jgi:AraC family ethanolamine operon transcriptional activator
LSSVEEFRAVELLENASAAVGWTIEYRQLEAGGLKAWAELVQRGELTIVIERVNRRVEVVGEPPPGTVCVTIPMEGNQLRTAGQTLDEHQAIVFAPGAEAHVSTIGLAGAVSIHVRETSLSTEAEALSRNWEGLAKGSVFAVRAGDGALESLRRRVLASSRQDVGGGSNAELGFELLTRLVILISEPNGEGRSETWNSFSSRQRVLSKARDYLDDHLDSPIRMAEVCRHVGASLSSIERLFREELQMTPTAYIRARRLAAARRELLKSDSAERTISQVAFDHGFQHLGRFAADFRSHFGVSPSVARSQARLSRRHSTGFVP